MPILWQIRIMYDMIMGWRRSGCSLVQGGVMDGSNITIAQGVGCAFMLAFVFCCSCFFVKQSHSHSIAKRETECMSTLLSYE